MSYRARSDVFRPFLAFFALKSVTFDHFDPNKGSSYKLLPSIITYSEGIIARQWESVEKGVTRSFRGNLVPFFVRETVNFQYFGLKI